jgi:hypothetical protein
MHRQAVVFRLNFFARLHTSQHERVLRRDLNANPLTVGEAVCTRLDCLYSLEKKDRASSSDKRSKGGRWRSGDALGPVLTSMSQITTARHPPKHERYRTSLAAVGVLLGSLESQGYDFGRPSNANAAFRASSTVGSCSGGNDDRGSLLVVADICGCPQDSIVKALLNSTRCSLICNDFHARGTVTSHIFMSKLDASLSSFPDAFRTVLQTNLSPLQSTTDIDVIITSPPFSLAIPILLNAFHIATSLVAMKLSMQFLCPGPTCVERREFLISHPPSAIIPLSRSDNREFYDISIDEGWFVWLIPGGKMQCPPLRPFSFFYPRS